MRSNCDVDYLDRFLLCRRCIGKNTLYRLPDYVHGSARSARSCIASEFLPHIFAIGQSKLAHHALGMAVGR
jgi:hypothetical protein